ncbi:MAG TPA: MMPL family transporter [Gallionella sp.]|nr:MMPL family transporter [Gallionella sp.]
MSLTSARQGRTAIALWLAFILVCGIVIGRSQFTTDLSAFFPRSPTPEQRLLLEQIRDGLASRLILVGIEGADAPTRARLSRQIAGQLRSDPAFVSVNNGEPINAERDRAFLFDHRYLLSPAVTPERFSAEGLHAALSESIDLLASPAGLLVKSLLPRDPSGEMMQLIEQLGGGTHPRMVDGAWASRDGTRALMLMQTRASGSDTDAQQRAMAAIRQAFDKTVSLSPRSLPKDCPLPNPDETTGHSTKASKNDAQVTGYLPQAGEGANVKSACFNLVMTGPGVFSVTSREAIQSQVSRLSLVSVALIATLLLLVYRSVTALALGFLPVISGALAGVAAVSLGFGAVHGITLGFGTALIGEAVDYSIYLFVQSEQNESDAKQQNWIRRFWPTIRLGVLTSIAGFASLLLSGFPGLAQLGLYSIAGLIVAAAVTRFVLPHLLPAKFRIHDVSAIGLVLSRLVQRAAKLRGVTALLLLAACAILAGHRDSLWNDQISSLSPVSQAEVALDASLRADMGASDVRYLVVASGPSRESVLQSAEQVAAILQTQVDQGELAGFESPSRYLPSTAMQRARLASLPAPAVLETRLAQAAQDLPVSKELFAPFLADVDAARSQPLLQATDLAQTSMAMALDALLLEQTDHWSALLPLTAPEGADIDAGRIRTALNAANLSSVLFVDMKSESDRLYSGYLHEAILLSLGGLIAIVGLLLWVFRSPMHMARLLAPLAAAVVTVTAGLALFGLQLTILHLVGLLLVVAVGSNYALFFDRADCPVAPRTLASMLFANLTTVAGFGVLAFSNVSILQAMGVTVAPGVILALIYSAIFARTSRA